MTTNQEGRQAAIRDSTSSAYGVAADWHALFDDAGISAGTFNERLLAWINAELSASYSNLVSAMQAYAEDAGYDGWEDMATLVLAMNGAETLLDGETQGLAFDFTDQSALIIDTGTPANNYDSTGIVSSGSLVGPSGKLTYTSPSNKLTLQSDGVMRYQAHNLCTYSEEIDNGAWGKNGTPTITANADGVAELWTPAASSTQHWLREPAYTAVAGVTYVFSVRVKPNGYTNLQLFAGSTESGTTSYCNFVLSGSGSKGTEGATATGSISAVGDGYYDLQLQVTVTGSTATASFYLCAISSSTAARNETWTPDGASGYYVARAHHYRYPANTDYIRTSASAVYALPLEYSATDGSCLGLLVEEARTNLCLMSTQFDNAAWTATQSSISSNAADSPSGLADADKLIENNANTVHYILPTANITVVSGTVFSVSVYAKADTRYRIRLGYFDNTLSNGVRVDANLTAGTIGTAAADGTGAVTSSGIDSVGGGWYRVWVSGSQSSSTSGKVFIALLNDAGTLSYLGDSTSGLYLWNVQLEAGSFPTSPIITYGAAATRAADPLSQLATTFPLSATAGSLYAYVAPYAGADLAGIVSLNDGSGDEEIVIYKDASANIVAQVEDGGVGQLAPLDSTVNASSGTAFKVALAWAANDFALSANGTAAQTDTGGTLPTVTTLEIGVDQANNYFNGHIKAIAYWPRRRANSELQTVTT